MKLPNEKTANEKIRIPQCWTKRTFDLQLHSDEELENLNEFALYEISRYYLLISGETIVLPLGLSMYLRVKRWWIEEILSNSQCIV